MPERVPPAVPDAPAPPPTDAWTALRSAAVAVPLDAVGGVRLTGPDRVPFLQGNVSADVAATPAGGSVATLFLDPKGRPVAQASVQRRDDDLHLAVEDDAADLVLATLRRQRVFDDVELHDLREVLRTWTVQGPTAPDVVAAAFGARASHGAAVQRPFASADVLLVAHDRTAEGGVDVHALARDAAAVADALHGAGATPADAATLEPSRIEAQLARAGLEARGGVLPHEVGLERYVSTTKGCYVGQETIARLDARAVVRRHLVRLRLDAPVPADASSLHADGKRVGRLGGRAHHPDLGVVALAVLQDAARDAALEVRDEDGARHAGARVG